MFLFACLFFPAGAGLQNLCGENILRVSFYIEATTMNELLHTADASLRHPWAAALIFLFTFVMISFRRMRLLPIGRPSAALSGAVMMVLFGVVKPEEAYRLVSWDTICLLLGMMIIAEHLRAAGLFERCSRLVEKFSSPFGLLMGLSFSSAMLAAILVNDPVCVVMTPLVIEVCRRKKLNPFPYLMILATSTNIGSALTLTGNPQNMIVGSLSGLSYLRFMALMAIPVAVALLVNALFAWLYYRNDLLLKNASVDAAAIHARRESVSETVVKTRRLRLGMLGLGLACLGFITGFSMAFSALAGAVIVITFHRKDPAELLEKMEWSLLLFFASLFVVIGGLQTSGLAKAVTEWAMHLISGEIGSQIWTFSGITLVGSNLLSNVPFVLLASQSIPSLGNPDLFWCLLAYVGTMAGNMTLFGAVANMIVAETAKDDCKMTFWGYARFGIPSTIISMILGIIILGVIFVDMGISPR
jgi:Na+/H+ antiporter NhaD/arsenite permease-like protein